MKHGPRGFLANYPPDVVAVVNGQPITRADILRGRQKRQVRQLDLKRRSRDDIAKPGFVWVFDNGPILPFGGTWLYIRTHKTEWQVSDDQTRLKVMQAFPCGELPIIENYGTWKQAFIETHRRPDRRSSRPQGLALCWIKLDHYGQIKEIWRKP